MIFFVLIIIYVIIYVINLLCILLFRSVWSVVIRLLKKLILIRWVNLVSFLRMGDNNGECLIVFKIWKYVININLRILVCCEKENRKYNLFVWYLLDI